MKTAYTTAGLYHAWAHQTTPHGHAPAAISFNGPILKSYSTAIAELVPQGVLVSRHTYSKTTSRHINKTRRAASHLAECTVRGVSRGTGEILPQHYSKKEQARRRKAWAREEIAASVKLAAESHAASKRARAGKEYKEADAARHMANALRLADWFKVKAPAANLEVMAETLEKAKKREQARERAKQKRAEKENAEKVAAWIAGDDVSFPYAVDRVYIRRQGDEVETSKGARIPWTDAIALYRFIQSKHGEAWRKNGETFKIGNYQLDSVNGAGIVAGCHRISIVEIERLAKQEGIA